MVYYRIEVRRLSMREKILSLAKGNFIYETPKLCLSIEKLVFEVTAGTHGTASFLLENSFGTRVKGFGTVEEMCIDFLPFFDGTKNELTVDVDAGELCEKVWYAGNIERRTDINGNYVKPVVFHLQFLIAESHCRLHGKVCQ